MYTNSTLYTLEILDIVAALGNGWYCVKLINRETGRIRYDRYKANELILK